MWRGHGSCTVMLYQHQQALLSQSQARVRAGAAGGAVLGSLQKRISPIFRNAMSVFYQGQCLLEPTTVHIHDVAGGPRSQDLQ